MSYYPSGQHPCEYARKYYSILPNGNVFFEDGTPEEIKERFLKDFAEHCERKKKEAEQGIFSTSW